MLLAVNTGIGISQSQAICCCPCRASITLFCCFCVCCVVLCWREGERPALSSHHEFSPTPAGCDMHLHCMQHTGDGSAALHGRRVLHHPLLCSCVFVVVLCLHPQQRVPSHPMACATPQHPQAAVPGWHVCSQPSDSSSCRLLFTPWLSLDALVASGSTPSVWAGQCATCSKHTHHPLPKAVLWCILQRPPPVAYCAMCASAGLQHL